ncbi:hypothetical protein [Kiloniella majae]|uniref:hypothetical protein n=1 Tax=Kiloniella majae TaxID=1938558 RepID=UPI000A27781D|nr:hypothetical protein [Kiloniella majae]
MSELKPCPNPECGHKSDIPEISTDIGFGREPHVWCMCGVRGPQAGTGQEAIKAWNSLPRTSPEVDPRKVDPDILGLVHNLKELVGEIDHEVAPGPCKTINAGIEVIKALYEKCDHAIDIIQSQQAEIERLKFENRDLQSTVDAMRVDRILHNKPVQVVKLQARNKELEGALDAIAHPIKYIQAEARRQGCTINGQGALGLSNDASYLKSIAKQALAGAEEVSADVPPKTEGDRWET